MGEIARGERGTGGGWRRALHARAEARLAPWLTPVKRATGEAERDALFRFRYRVFVEELRRQIPGVDHARGVVRGPEDDAPTTHHLYCGPIGAPTGAIRVRAFEPGTVPDAVAARLSLHLFAGIERLGVAEVGHYLVAPTARGQRGGLVRPAIAQAVFLLLARELGADLAFCTCRPGLVPLYLQLGARPYGAPLLDEAEGMEIPLVWVLSDHGHQARVSAVTAPLVPRVFGRGKRAPLDRAPFQDLFDRGDDEVVTEPIAVREELRTAARRGDGAFLAAIGPEALDALAGQGIVLQVEAGTTVTRKTSREREAFVVLEGECEVTDGDRVLARLGAGHLLGEGALFRPTGERSASIRAATRARIMVLRRSFLIDLAVAEPEAAVDVMLAMGHELSERVAAVAGAVLARSTDPG